MSSPDPGRPLLAIDTSTMRAGLALYTAEGVLGEVQWAAGRNQTTALMTEIDRLLGQAGLGIADVGALAVATGPGSFNGLRVGLSVAKGLVFACGVPLVGVPTLDATAYPHTAAGRPVRAVLVAGRGRLVSALYRWRDGALRRASEYENSALDGLAATIVEPTLVCGELDAATAGRLAELAPDASIAPPALRERRAACLAELAWARLGAGDVDDPVTLEPVYLHGPVPSAAASPPSRARGGRAAAASRAGAGD